MKFAIVQPAETKWEVVEAANLTDIYANIGGLDLPDHNVIAPPGCLPSGKGLAIVVNDFSLHVPPRLQRYFVIGRTLFGGNAVLYAFNEQGDSVDIDEVPVIIFMSLAGVEDAIAQNQIDRPEVRVNGQLTWQWPNKPQ